ncbi:MAG: hypothetical protein NTW85_08865 [Methylococcales bacterium]|nr:hypothetical protein [Methylococcales bacterium]
MPKTINESEKVVIEESEMKFGYYSTDDLFCIENSKIYAKLQNSSVKTVEFALFKKNKNQATILLIEAKKTAPNLLKSEIKLEEFVKKEMANTKNLDKTLFLDELYTKVKHDIYFDDLQSKFNDTLALLAAVYMNLHNTAKLELPKNFKDLEFSAIRFVLVLVVKNHQTESLNDLQSKLEKKLKPLVKIWKQTSVAVLNEEIAKKRGYIVND